MGLVKPEEPKIVAVDLFCGAGGLTFGLNSAGIEVRAGIDVDPHCKFAYKANNPDSKFTLKSVKDIDGNEIRLSFGDSKVTLLCGCAPCQTFSTYNKKANIEDERWWLLSEFGRLIEEAKPTLITMENVPGLAKHKVFKKFLEVLDRHSYHYSFSIVDCTQYGIPQTRNRLVLLASQLGPIQIIPPTTHKPKTVKDAIGCLSNVSATSNTKYDSLHISQKLSPLNEQRIAASVPGGTWKDWDTELLCQCHKKKTGATYSAVYGRIEWDKPSPTITTQFYNYGSGRFGHPEKNRALSLREGALIQTFPSDYIFADGDNLLALSSIGKLIGNAVPPRLGEIIGESFKEHVREQRNKQRQ